MADFGLTAEVRDIRDRVREFIDKDVIPAEDVLDGNDAEAYVTMEALKAEAKRRGLWALGHPKEIGGGGLPFMPFVLPERDRSGARTGGRSRVGSLSMQDSIMLHLYGTDGAEATRWLEPLVAGDIYPSVGLTEPEVAGSDPTLMQSTARARRRRLGDQRAQVVHHRRQHRRVHHRLRQHRARRDQPVRAVLRRSSCPPTRPGYEIVRVVPTMGHTGGGHCEIRLTDVRVPRSNLLGGRGEGFVIAQKRLGPGRIFHCMRWLGQAQRAFELMCDARQRPASRTARCWPRRARSSATIAESAAEIQARAPDDARRRARDGQGGEARVEIALIKFWGARMLHDVIDRAIQVHGALGVTADTPLEFMYREARYARIYDGPDEVHRMIVARRLLKDPNGAPWARA